MWIQIRLDDVEPPRGRAELLASSDEPQFEAFVGWLGLLHALYALLDASERGRPNPSVSADGSAALTEADRAGASEAVMPVGRRKVGEEGETGT
jgi:hypothetical protein